MAVREVKQPKLRERLCPHCNKNCIIQGRPTNAFITAFRATLGLMVTRQLHSNFPLVLTVNLTRESFSCESLPRSSPELDNDSSMCLTDIDDSESFPPLSGPGLSDSDSHSHDEDVSF